MGGGKVDLAHRLLNLFNVLGGTNSSVRADVLLAALHYAVASKSGELLLGQVRRLEEWLGEWTGPREQLRVLLRALRALHLENAKSLSAHRYLVRYLATFEATEADASVLEEAAGAATEAVRLPEVFQLDQLLELPVTRHLETSAQHAPLLRLLRIFAHEDLQAFFAFQAAHPGFLEARGLAPEECLKKIRLLTLASLASQQRQLPYALVANTLQIDEADVEAWVVSAIAAKLIDARMDQLQRLVIVRSPTVILPFSLSPLSRSAFLLLFSAPL